MLISSYCVNFFGDQSGNINDTIINRGTFIDDKTGYLGTKTGYLYYSNHVSNQYTIRFDQAKINHPGYVFYKGDSMIMHFAEWGFDFESEKNTKKSKLEAYMKWEQEHIVKNFEGRADIVFNNQWINPTDQ